MMYIVMACNYIFTTCRIVQSFEDIAISLVQQENFTELTVTNENIAVRIERVSKIKERGGHRSHRVVCNARRDINIIYTLHTITIYVRTYSVLSVGVTIIIIMYVL